MAVPTGFEPVCFAISFLLSDSQAYTPSIPRDQFKYADVEGFEPTTLGLTGRRSNHYIAIRPTCGDDENRTHHTNLAKVYRQPWYMRPHWWNF